MKESVSVDYYNGYQGLQDAFNKILPDINGDLVSNLNTISNASRTMKLSIGVSDTARQQMLKDKDPKEVSLMWKNIRSTFNN